MKAYRFNTEKREDRKFNTTGKEKNPLNLKFYASNLEYAKKYQFIYNEDGEIISECSLEVVEIKNVNLFDMQNNYATLQSFNNYTESQVASMRKDYTYYLNKATKKSDIKLFQGFLNGLDAEKEKIAKQIESQEFQAISDFENQLVLVAELKSLGFQGYTTRNEIVIF